MGAKIVEKRPMRDRDSVGEAGRAARILEVADFVAAGLRQIGG